MSQQQKINFRLLKALLLQLRAYGLNPRDWRFARDRSSFSQSFSIHHRDDRSFTFQGIINRTPQGLQWQSLHLVSL